MNIKQVFDQLYSTRSQTHLANDPLSFCYRFETPEGREIAAVIASSFAYGAVGIILRTLESVFSRIGKSPRAFIDQFEPAEGMQNFKGFKHRINDSRDLCALFWAIKTVLNQSGSINNFFLQGHNGDAADITNALNSYSTAIRGFDYQAVFGCRQPPPDSYFNFFFPAPASGSACKRLCMFLRWLVRPADGIDMGLWHGISPAQLVIPVDTHIQRICGYLGFSRRKSADWRMACEITDALRKLDPHDPVKYDFALAHIGISDGCNGSDPSVCRHCQISNICPEINRIKDQ